MIKTDGCKNNPEKSSTTKLRKYIPSSFHSKQYHHLNAKKILKRTGNEIN